MMSLLQELVNEYLEAAVAFGQVFLVSGLIVALGYWLKLRIFGSPPPKQKRLAPKQAANRTKRSVKPKQSSLVQTASREESIQVSISPEPSEAPVPAGGWIHSLESHSKRLAAYVQQAAGRGERVNKLQELARVRLDAADYTFHRLLQDLASVIPVSAKPAAQALEEPVAPSAEEHIKLAA